MNKRTVIGVVLLLCSLARGYPNYQGSGSAISILPGQCVFLYSGERPLTGAFSQQVFVPTRSEQTPANLSFELIWPSDPGAFNIQVQDADTDATGNYVTVPLAGTITSAPQAAGSGNFVARTEFSPWRASYGRLYVNTQTTNVVNLTAKVCR